MSDTPTRSPAAFGKKADSYDAHANVQRDAAAWLAEWLPKDCGAESCLEFGSGTGLFTRHLIDHFVQVEATDVEGRMVAKCRQALPKVRHRVRDAWAEQADRGCWDFVASSSLLQWAGDPVNTLRRWSDLLCPQRRMLLGFFIDPSLPEMNQVIGSEHSPVHWRSHQQWCDIFKAAELELLRTECRTERYEYESALHFWKSLHGTGAAVSQHMRPSQMLKFFREYDTAFACDKGVYATWTFCRAELRRRD